MGADIHSYVEVFDGTEWTWNKLPLFDHGYAGCPEPWEPFDRYYPLFGFLAGVRDVNMPRITPGRHGLPDDVSAEVRAEIGPTLDELMGAATTEWGRTLAVQNWNGLHGHGWLTGAEILEYDFDAPCRWHEGETVGELLGGWLDRLREIAYLMPNPHHVRVVYAFDN